MQLVEGRYNVQKKNLKYGMNRKGIYEVNPLTKGLSPERVLNLLVTLGQTNLLNYRVKMSYTLEKSKMPIGSER